MSGDFAIVKSGGKQYLVRCGSIIKVERISEDLGSKVNLEVLALAVGENSAIQREGHVTAEILEHRKEKKVVVFKKKRRKDYHRTRGHRQQISLLKITKVSNANV